MYFTLKAVHIASVVLLLGNVTVTGYWAAHMYRWGRAHGAPFRPVARAILWTDLLFTLGGGAGIAITGTAMVLTTSIDFWHTPWLLKGVGALALSTLAWLVVLLPDQFKMERTTDADELRRLFRRWNVVGWGSTALLFYALWCMTTKR